jgi:hypothetical protein
MCTSPAKAEVSSSNDLLLLSSSAMVTLSVNIDCNKFPEPENRIVYPSRSKRIIVSKLDKAGRFHHTIKWY